MSATIERIAPHLDDAARSRLRELVDQVRAEPERVSTLFPAVGRTVVRGPSDPSDVDGLRTPRLEDEARAALLVTVAEAWRDEPERLVDEVSQLYRYGDTDEKRAVLRALPELDSGPQEGAVIGAAALPVVADALRTNDLRLISAAMGPYAARHLDDDSWRQGVLKCLFVGVPLDAVADLDRRADAELARMVADYGNERVAAGRSVPSDAWRVLRHEPGSVPSGFPVPAGDADEPAGARTSEES